MFLRSLLAIQSMHSTVTSSMHGSEAVRSKQRVSSKLYFFYKSPLRAISRYLERKRKRPHSSKTHFFLTDGCAEQSRQDKARQDALGDNVPSHARVYYTKFTGLAQPEKKIVGLGLKFRFVGVVTKKVVAIFMQRKRQQERLQPASPNQVGQLIQKPRSILWFKHTRIDKSFTQY